MHSLPGNFSIIIFLIKLKFRLVNFFNSLFQLFNGKVSISSSCGIIALQIEGIFYCCVTTNIL